MGNDGLSTGDLALLQNDGGMGGANAWVWFFMLMFLAGNGNWGGGGNGNLVTQSELTNQLNAQAQSAQLQQLGLVIGNQNYETAQQIYSLQTNLMNQNNTNLINAIQDSIRSTRILQLRVPALWKQFRVSAIRWISAAVLSRPRCCRIVSLMHRQTLLRLTDRSPMLIRLRQFSTPWVSGLPTRRLQLLDRRLQVPVFS